MKLKNKGKVYPSPSPSSSSSSSSFSGEDYLSILKLLPAAILALASVLSLEDREVLAYMITRSLKTTTTTTNNNPSLISQDYSTKKRSSKKPPPTASKLTQKSGVSSHKPPVFDCDCFDCYTSYWFRWDSSPNRELIHQVIEAFEDHLTNGETQKPSKKSARPKRRDSNSKTATRVSDSRFVDIPSQPDHEVLVLESSTVEAPVFSGTLDRLLPICSGLSLIKSSLTNHITGALTPAGTLPSSFLWLMTEPSILHQNHHITSQQESRGKDLPFK